MEDENKTPATDTEEIQAEAQATISQDPAAMAARIAALNHENADRRFKIKALTAQVTELEAKTSQLDDLNKRLSEIDQSLKTEREARAKAEHEALAVRTATKYGLPAELATRLAGATPEEIESDAKVLAQVLKAKAPALVEVNPGNVGGDRPSRATEVLTKLTGSTYTPKPRTR